MWTVCVWLERFTGPEPAGDRTSGKLFRFATMI